jgi:hypothetical protein
MSSGGDVASKEYLEHQNWFFTVLHILAACSSPRFAYGFTVGYCCTSGLDAAFYLYFAFIEA